MLCSAAVCTTVELLPEFDQFGAQIETVQAFQLENDLVIQSGGAGVSEWTNIQFTWDQSTGAVQIYQDGVEVGYLDQFDSQVSAWDIATVTSNREMFVGLDVDDNAGPLAGMLDDVAWFDRALSGEELDALRTMGVAQAQLVQGGALSSKASGGNLVAHWDFDQATGTVALGDSGTDIDFRLAGGSRSPAFRPGQGQFGGALQFDGQDDYASFQDASFDVGTRGTVSFWVKLDDVAAEHQFFDMSPADGLDFWYQPGNNGQLVAVVNQYAEEPKAMYAIYDTGASVVTVSAYDQLLYELGGEAAIPAKVVGGAAADAIGGSLQGDVSVAGTIIADGMHAVTITDGGLGVDIDFSRAARAPGVQLFLGTEEGSNALPNITGVPIHSASLQHPNGVAARIDMTAYSLDLGALFPEFFELQGIVIDMPDLEFVHPGEKVVNEGANVTEAVRVPMALWGVNNHLDPGDQITAVENPVQEHVRLQRDEHVVADQAFLFDTGAQLSIISTDIALALGINPFQPETMISVQGADGNALDVPGFTLDSLELPYDNDADGEFDGALELVNVPVYVLDMIEGLDGILGMNLFNSAKTLLYDPFDSGGASVQMSFRTDYIPEDLGELELGSLELLAEAIPALNGALPGQNLPNFGVIPNELVGSMMQPAASLTNTDLGYIDVQWSSPGSLSLGISTQSIDTGDILVNSDGFLSIDRVQSLGDNVWRYYYGEDGESLREGEVRVTFVGGEVTDVLGTLSTERAVTFTLDTSSPTITDLQLNMGQQDPADLPAGSQPTSWVQQRSKLRDVTLTFSEPVQLAAEDLQLINLGVNAPVDLDLPVPLRSDQLAFSGNQITITFDDGQLSDGAYRLEISPNARDLAGNELDGDGNGAGGDAFVHQGAQDNGFYQLLADFNGDAGSSIFDFGAFAYWFGQSAGAAPDYMDLNADGGVSIYDFPRFAAVFGQGITFPTTMLAAWNGPTRLAAALDQLPRRELADDPRQAVAEAESLPWETGRTIERRARTAPRSIETGQRPDRLQVKTQALDRLLALEDWDWMEE